MEISRQKLAIAEHYDYGFDADQTERVQKYSAVAMARILLREKVAHTEAAVMTTDLEREMLKSLTYPELLASCRILRDNGYRTDFLHPELRRKRVSAEGSTCFSLWQ